MGIHRFEKPEEVPTDYGRQYFSWRGKSDFQNLFDKEGIRHGVARSHHLQTPGKWPPLRSVAHRLSVLAVDRKRDEQLLALSAYELQDVRAVPQVRLNRNHQVEMRAAGKRR